MPLPSLLQSLKERKIYIEGQIETRKFPDNSGAERYTTEIVLRPYRGELTMLDGRPCLFRGRSGGHPVL